MQQLIDFVNKIEDLILKSLSATDREILSEYVSQQLKLATNKMVQDGLEKILKQVNKGWTDFEHSPQCLSVKYFEKNIFTLTPFQYRVAFLQETADKVRDIFTNAFYSRGTYFDEVTTFIIDRTLLGFQDILVAGINFMGKPSDDIYYESRKKEYEFVTEVHKEFVKRDCGLLRALFKEIDA